MKSESKPLSLAVVTCVLLLLLLAYALRIGAINGSEVDAPIRADARDYYFYALNWRECGVYSRRAWDESGQCPDNLSADAQRSPGYPLFLTPFVEFPPSSAMVRRIQTVQALLGVGSVLLAFLVFRAVLGNWMGVLASFFVSLSPHLVASGVYVLTEVLFTFLLMAWLWTSILLFRSGRGIWALVSGLLLGATALTRPTMLYFVLFFLPFLYYVLPSGKRTGGILVLVGFLIIYSPWFAHNRLNLPTGAADSSLALDTVHKGMYPNLTFKGDPRTYGFPNRVDPDWAKRKDMRDVLDEIARRVGTEPAKYFHWYLIGKPIMFLSWDIVVGFGDVWIYPLRVNPYDFEPLLKSTHRLMHLLHWPLVVLALIGCLLAWVPRETGPQERSQRIALRLMSLLMLYFLAVHVVGTPLPRYSVPLRPVIYGLALATLQILWQLKGKKKGD